MRDIPIQPGQDEQEMPEHRVKAVDMPSIDDIDDILFGFFAEIVQGHYMKGFWAMVVFPYNVV